MTTRRRLLGAMTALGLFPSAALAQSTNEPQLYQCVKNVGTKLPKTYVKVRGTPDATTLAEGEYTNPILPNTITAKNGMTPFESGPKGSLAFRFQRLDPLNPAIFLSNMVLEVHGLYYDRPLDNSPNSDLVVAVTDLRGEALFDIRGGLRKYSSKGTEASVSFNMVFHYSGGTFQKDRKDILRTHKHFTKLLNTGGSYIINVNDPAKGLSEEDAILTIRTVGQALYKVPKILLADINAQADRLKAGECDEYSSECFLTTATSEALGLPDDCWELETLRKFRDGPLQSLDGGPSLIARYYAEAPAIVETLPITSHRAMWARTWLFGVLPAAILCRIGRRKAALRIYRRMFLRLAAKV